MAAKRSDDVVYLRREVVREPLLLKPPPKAQCHLYCSEHNIGALEFVELLSSYYDAKAKAASDDKGSSRRATDGLDGTEELIVTSDPNQMGQATHFLCYLNGACSVRSENLGR